MIRPQRAPLPHFEWPDAVPGSNVLLPSGRRRGEGSAGCQIAFVGEAYGGDEEEKARPWIGPAGRLLYFSAMRPLGLQRGDVYMTNLVNKRPSARSNDIAPYCSVVEQESRSFYRLTSLGEQARDQLLEELEAARPDVIVPLGAVAMCAVAGITSTSIFKMRGSPLPGVAGAKFVVPSLHPSGILMSGDYMARRLLAADVRKALALADGSIAPLKRTYELDPHFDRAIEYLRFLRTVPEFSFDIETPNGAIKCIGFADSATHAVSIVYDPTRWSREQLKQLWAETKLTLECPNVRKITQNGHFDTFWLRFWHDIRVPLDTLDDTMVLHHIAHPDLKKSLAMLTSLHTCEVFYKDDGATARSIGSLNDYLLYNAKDAVVTFEVWQKIKGWKGLFGGGIGLTYDRTMALLPDLQEMQSNGFAVDYDRYAAMKKDNEAQAAVALAELTEELKPWIEETRATLTAEKNRADAEAKRLEDELAVRNDALRSKRKAETALRKERKKSLRKRDCKSEKPPAVEIPSGSLSVAAQFPLEKAGAELRSARNVRSAAAAALRAFEAAPVNPRSDDMKDYFYRFLGILPFRARKKKGQKEGRITLDDDALAALARGTATRPPIRAASLIRKCRSIDTERDNFLSWETCPDGRYRCEWNPRGTGFGRFSSNQLFFRYGTNGQNMPPHPRSILIADPPTSDRFHFLVTNDKKQIEWVVVAYRSGDERMIEALRGDTHAHTAALMSGATEELIKWEDKKFGKETNPERLRKLRMESGRWDEFKVLRVLPSNMTLRQMGKKANHALNYGEGELVYATTNEILIADARTQIGLYHNAYPGVRQWHSQTAFFMQQARSRHETPLLVTATGRVIPFEGDVYDSHYLKSILAAEPQSVAVDSINPAMRRIRLEMPGVQLRAQTHDDITSQFWLDRHKPLLDEANRLSSDFARLLDWMSPELEINGRKFRVPNELKLGMNMGDFAPVDPKDPTAYSNPRGMRGVDLNPDAIAERLREFMS